ncbi:hypothetical protein MCHI_003980 [Candidatus Magnetoovum chiemensis]|nr:hypothetical protein MCHI_003980 [Candidatus Magnetoovum chiemensis]
MNLLLTIRYIIINASYKIKRIDGLIFRVRAEAACLPLLCDELKLKKHIK